MKHFWPLALEARTPFHLLVAPLYSINTVTSKCSNGTSKRLHVQGLLSMQACTFGLTVRTLLGACLPSGAGT